VRTFIGVVVGALVVAAGAGAYNAAVTPSQFSALKHQVQTLQGRVSKLQGQVSSLQSSAARESQDSSTVACLKQNWNAITIWSWDTYALNSTKYDSSQVDQLAQDSIVMAPTATATKC
jgi:outer membrane murein-binding lipoprotein Lpp